MSLLLRYNFIYGVIETQSLCLSVQLTSRLHYSQFRVSLAMVTVRLPSDVNSSVGGGRGGYILSIGLSTKMQTNENATFLALLRLLFALEWTKK